MDNYHLTKKLDGWQLRKEGSDIPLISAETKADAINLMRELMQNKVGSVKIHGENGKIQEERTYPRSLDPQGSVG